MTRFRDARDHFSRPRGGRAAARRSQRRRGISLLEVLISMFVLLVGLMGVAALIPAGRHEMIEGSKSDRASAIGNAALHELKTRGMLNPNSWSFTDGSFVYTNGAFTGLLPPYAIDPLGVASGNFPPTVPAFPTVPSHTTGAPPPLTRITLGPGLSAANRKALADDVFRSRDDLLFNLLPSAGENLPPSQQSFLSGSTPLKRMSQGDYSWLVTVVPAIGTSMYTVSVVVFYQRDLSTSATERIVDVPLPFPGGGISGGEVILQAQYGSGSDYADLPTASNALGVKAGEWLMLAGQIPGNPVSVLNKWYRIVAAQDQPQPASGVWTRQVTLVGPDWPYAASSTPPPPTPVTQAWLFSGVIAVYERTVQLELE